MFNRLKGYFGRNERKSVEFSDLLLSGFGTPTASGIPVSPESALRCAPVFAAVRVLAETFASLPVTLYRKTADGGREKATDHALFPLLTEAPNPWTPASEFRLLLMTNLCLHGNAYAYVNRVGGKIREIIQLDPRFVLVQPDPITTEPVYQVTNMRGDLRDLDRSEVLHIRGIGASLPHVGASPVVEAREAIGLALVLEQHAAGLFGRGARPAGVLEYPKQAKGDMLERIRQSFTRVYGGGTGAGQTAILEEGLKFTPLQLSSVDAQFLEMRMFQLREIARIWRVPLHLLQDLERVTHSNAEEMGQQFLSGCILPQITLWEDSIRLTCLTPEERGEYVVSFDVDALARADIAARFTAYSQAISAGVLNPNEAREMENRPAYTGGETFTRPVNTAPVQTTEAANV